MNLHHKLSAALHGSRSGQTMVMFALMLTVLLGFLSLAIDVGSTYTQRRFMQNAADASAIAGARAIANGLQPTCSSGTACTNPDTWSFLTNDAAIRTVVDEYLNENGGLPLSGKVYQGSVPCAAGDKFCLQYGVKSGGSCASGTTLDGGWCWTKSPTVGGAIPNETARVRVQTQVEFSTLLAGFVGKPKMAAGARSTAQVFPVAKDPNAKGKTWPITRRKDEDASPPAPDDGTCPLPVTFWSPNEEGAVVGNFKGVFYGGKTSAYKNTLQNRQTDPSVIKFSDHIQMLTTFDPADPFATTPPPDLVGDDIHDASAPWFSTLWQGEITPGAYLAPPTDAEQEPTIRGADGLSDWQRNRTTTYAGKGDKAEVITGNLGANISTAMKTYVHNNRAGKDPCGGWYTNVKVYLWDTAEEWIPPSNKDQYGHFKTLDNLNGNPGVARVSFVDYKIYRFYDAIDNEGYPVESFPSSSEINGYAPSIETDADPIEGGDLTTGATTVRVVE